MNNIIDSELLGIKFLHQFGANSRQEESLNSQINSIKHIIKMLNNELTLANTDKEGMDAVFEQEQTLLITKDKMMKQNDVKVQKDLSS